MATLADTRGSRARRLPGELGLWIWIFGEMVFYTVLFASFVHDRSADPALFNASAATVDTTLGAINTILLLTGSLFVALGVRAIRSGRSSAGASLFTLAFATGAIFLIDKVVEYHELIGAHHEPTTNSYYTYFFIMTAIHAAHVVAALVVLVVMWRISRKATIGVRDVRAVESGATWWHLVDLLWIVLFPLLYLVR